LATQWNSRLTVYVGRLALAGIVTFTSELSV
jgi:hypothetical protein